MKYALLALVLALALVSTPGEAGNITTTPIWVIDTASSTNLIACGTFVTIKSIRWVGATATTHTASVTDCNGNEIWASTASVVSWVDSFSWGRTVNGLRVPTLASGKLYIEF